MRISPKYWRESNKTDVIYNCFNNPDSCIGGTDDNLCK